MKSQSIYKQFQYKLIVATSIFVVILAFIFYGFTKATIYDDISQNLLKDAKLIYKLSTNMSANQDISFKVIANDDTTIDLVSAPHITKLTYRTYIKDHNNYIELHYPFDMRNGLYIKITKNINHSHEMLNKIFSNLMFLALGGLVMVVLYAFTVSKTLLTPIINITNTLSNMDVNSLTTLDTRKLPVEFRALAMSINNLTKRIENYVKYQKELFIGTAHELKTPLTVMKLKSEITIRKEREPQKYVETLKVNITEIDKMNIMISSILDIGRQEGAQFERPMEVDIIDFLKLKTQDYKLLANSKNIDISFTSNSDKFIIIIQPTLLTQIIQNFVQNAIKFTAKNKSIMITTLTSDYNVKIEVIDEGIGCDDTIDLFAPFERKGEESGAGLGLFLAKSAADTLGATISLKNRTDDVAGAVATLELDIHPTCKIV